MSDLGIPIGIAESAINSMLNSFLLFVFGMGMYAVLYLGTMYIYLARSSTTNRRVVPATITLLFLSNIFQTGVHWYGTKWSLVDNGDARDSVFVSLFEGPNWFEISLDISTYTGFVLSDGLLIWRCFFVWNRSFRAISLPLLLFITEIALFLAGTVFRIIFGSIVPSNTTANIFNNVESAAFFMTFAASLFATVLIAYRIYSVSKQGVSERRFQHIINIIVQSGAIYSVSLLFFAISLVIPDADDPLNTRAIAMNDYTGAIANIIGGVATTALVARVSMLPTNTTFPSTSIHLSGIQFHACSTHHTDTPEVIEVSHHVSATRNSTIEGLQDEGKVDESTV